MSVWILLLWSIKRGSALLEINCDHFVIQDAGHFNNNGVSLSHQGNRLLPDEQFRLPGILQFRKTKRDCLRSDGEEIAEGAFHRHGVG